MNGSASAPIALCFVLAIIPFALWTWWMLHEDRAIREAHLDLVATARGNVRRLPVSEPSAQVVAVRAGSFCRVAGTIGFTPTGETLVCTPSALGMRARWRREQLAA